MIVKTLTGDCREILPTLEPQSVHCCVTSPPYFGLRDYGVDGQIGLEGSPDEYVSELVGVFRDVRRVLRDDGTLWLNLGDSWNNFRSQMGPGQALDKRKLNGKPSQESKRRGCKSLKEKDLIGIPWRVAFALQADGWYLRSDIIWSKPNPMPESVTDRPTKAHEYLFLLAKNERYYYDQDAIKEPFVDKRMGNTGGGGQYSTGSGRNDSGALKTGVWNEDGNIKGRNKRSVWEIPTSQYAGAHFAVFPEKLVEPCILAGCQEGGTVLDCFGGSGTVGRVALKHRRNAILIELNPEYVTLQHERTKNLQVNLF